MLMIVPACSLNLKIALFNNTKGPVTVYLPRAPTLVKMVGTRMVVIGAGKSAQYDYPKCNEEWTLRISTGRCDISYMVPYSLDHVPWPDPGHYGTALKAQLESDLAIYVLPWHTETIANVASLGPIQADGFQLQPTSRSYP
jgi:hypothetical protein